jgi:glycosyltransferase involved in cell wall biosynthesis
MATFNRPQFLRAAVESVLSQSLRDFEFLIADDGSDAPTRELLRQFEPAVRVLWLEHRGNPGAARNAAVRVATGRYVAFMDSDDVWSPSKLERQVHSLRTHTRCRWSYTACDHIDESGTPVSPVDVQPWKPHRGPMLAAVARSQAHSALPSVMVERELLMEAGLFDENLAFYEDHDLWLRLALRSDANAIEETLVQVRRHREHYSGHDLLRTAECRAVFLDRVWQHMRTSALRAEICRTRSLHAAHLARLRAGAGFTDEARAGLRDSFAEGWRYWRWWMDAVLSMVPR